MASENRLIGIINEIGNTEYTSEELKGMTFEDLGFDSLLIVRLLVQLEDEFEVEITDEDLTSPILLNYDSLLEFLNKKKSE